MVRVACSLAVLGWLLSAGTSRAEDSFAIDLEVHAAKATKTAHAQASGLGVKPKDREILEIKAGERITVKWKLRNTDPKATYKDVTVHFFAVKEEKAGQPTVPKLSKDVAAESMPSAWTSPRRTRPRAS